MAVPIGTLFSLDASLFARSQEQCAHVNEPNQPALNLVGEALAALEIAEETGVKAALPTGTSGTTCNTCGIQSFSSPDDQRRHFKTNWHRLNVKRRVASLDPVTEEHFLTLIENDEDRDEVGSLSGSDTDSDASSSSSDVGNENEEDDEDTILDITATPAGPQFIFSPDSLNTTSYAVWRCLLAPDRERGVDPPSDSECLDSLKNLVIEGGRWAIVLFRGGHFSAAIFDVKAPKPTGKTPQALLGSNNKSSARGEGTGENLDSTDIGTAATITPTKYSAAAVDAALTQIAHKSFHKYVVRAKAGGKQSTKDATGKFAKSAGSRLRRHNEAALERDITQLLTVEWSEQLAACSLILIAAPGSNAKTLFSGTPALLNRKDIRVRRVPFTTRRPTLSEAKRVARVLLTVYDASEAVKREKEQRLSILEEEKKKGKVEVNAEATAAAAAAAAAQRELAQHEEAAARAKNAEKRAKQKQRQKEKRQAEAAEKKAAEEEAAKEAAEDQITKAARQAAALAAQRAKTPAAPSLTSSIPKLSSSKASNMPAPVRLSSKPLASEDAAARRARMASAAEARAKALQAASSEQKLW
ncbi:putative Ankyrin repeat and zinc finger domain-containing protein 1 [Nannochloris sp. 'desiccata']|nr:hypothetical protein KSW81_001486 [Chlorella desiccata (nom. nud.)]KAH7616849.1 putative Ankyrin repeat and zinc finger domain-containing protein 1 [Chlorella desiccata (nom. nud.)]